ncbi:Fatty-acid amide hydrolase 2 [Papilio machaon]|uniref:Fatty-acid amide hydrolase 2 n=1 Tax=Papilio machaon TaxID=76193 RepID=A0A194QK47_PAPMA|nr:Fatty-acid amide hydrolase 2 [Papilio machaon]
MEVGVWLIGVVLRALNALMAAASWVRARVWPAPRARRLPPPRNRLLLRSATDLAQAIRKGKREREYGSNVRCGCGCGCAGMSDSVGCVERSGSRAASDGAAVRRVRGAGAVPLLVSATPELCLGWETTSLLHGRTNNPYDLHCTPGGSSGGESALLASAASPLSVSSDIAGSIRIPAAFCGLFGHKPKPGIIPIEGHIPTLTDEMYPKFLTVGPICRHAEDLPLMLSVMAGDRKHLLNLQQPVDLANIKVHYMTEASTSVALLPVEPHIRDLILRAAKHLQDNCGATISERDKSLLVELVKSVFGMASRSLQALGFALISRTRLFIPRARTQHYQHLAHRLQLDIANTLGSDGVLLYPAHCGTAHAHGLVFLRAAGVLYTMPLNVLELPATVVPVHDPRHRLPLALQVIAGPNQDRLCLAVARQLERAFGGWRPPH